MDVSCERCRTDYEFDDSRITEAGVTVKCTTCGHVFKVKKKTPVVMVPMGDDALSVSPPTSIAAPPAGAGGFIPEKARDKEWKVRQHNGNVFTFRELTTLQRWIVERKVSREDEISLTGESWKRLGNIAELASFFQVVEDAQRGQQLQALQSAGALAYVPPGATPAGGYAIPSGDPPLQLNALKVGAAPASSSTAPTQPQIPVQPAPLAPAPYAPSSTAVPLHGAPQVNVTVHPSPHPPVVPGVPAARPHLVTQPLAPDDIAAAQIKQGGRGRGVLAVLALAVVGAGGYFGYTAIWIPQQEAKAREAQARADAERKAVEEEARRNAQEELAKKVAEEEARKKAEEEAKARAAAEAAADAGVVVVGGGKPGDTVAAGGRRDFDYWMNEGDRLRDREKAEKALDAYGRAADMNPDRAEPHAGRGLALLDMGNKLAAEASFLQALKLNPRYGVALMGLAETYRNQGKNDEAKKYYEQYLDVLPNGPEAAVARQALKRLQE